MLVAFDTETHLIKPGCITPRLVCVSIFTGEGEPALFDRHDGLDAVEELLVEGHDIVGHHVFFDLGVVCAERPDLLPLVFQRIDEGKIHCTKIRDMIILNARGELKFVQDELGELRPAQFHLANLAQRRLGVWMRGKKEPDAWRLRYNELDGVPLIDWPAAAHDYAVDDAGYTWLICQDQEREAGEEIPGELSQTQAAWALYLMGVWGVRTDPVAVAEFEHEVLTDYAVQEQLCLEAGFLREVQKGKNKGKRSRNMKAIKDAIVRWCEVDGRKVPLTDAGNIKTDRDTLALASNASSMADESRRSDGEEGGLHAVSELGRLGKLKTTYLPILKSGTAVPINATYNPIIETFRTSCRAPNCQNPPRKGKFRECFVPRVGNVYVFCDYGTLEMRTLAQVCIDLFGFSALGDALRDGKDPHLMVAADMLNIGYDEAKERLAAGDTEVEQHRTAAKPANFGFPGGMGPDAFVEYAWKGYGVRVTREVSAYLHGAFRRMWFEMEKYFDHCAGLLDRFGDEARYITFPQSGLVRGRVRYTAICNGFFQHLAAMGAKAALYQVSRECYMNLGTPLYGCRPVFFLHDEIGMEVPYGDPRRASAAADRLSEVMRTEMAKWVPDVPILAEAAMMRRWYKGSKPLREDGVLIPCRPVKQGGKTTWEADL